MPITMAMKTTLAVVGAGALITLQGCGGGSTTSAPDSSTTASPSPSPDPTPSPSPSPGPPSPGPATLGTTTMPLTTSLPAQPTQPLSGADAATAMNADYHGFDSNNPSGSIGTFIRITGNTHVYCHESCYSGWADCRVSGSVYNPKQIVDSSTGGISWYFKGTSTQGDYLGYWVNQTLIKQELGKCAYTFDGGTDAKYNMGCGMHDACPDPRDCDDKTCAYAGRDPATDYETYINGDSDAVNGAVSPMCTDAGTCAFRGPSFYKETGYVADETFQAWKWRADYGQGSLNLMNELVIDGELMLRQLNYNPAGTIPAIVYASTFPGGAAAGRTAALAMAQKLATDYNMPEPVPVIKIDLDVDVSTGDPFVFESASDVVIV